VTPNVLKWLADTYSVNTRAGAARSGVGEPNSLNSWVHPVMDMPRVASRSA
jgi:hypothetical protein